MGDAAAPPVKLKPARNAVPRLFTTRERVKGKTPKAPKREIVPEAAAVRELTVGMPCPTQLIDQVPFRPVEWRYWLGVCLALDLCPGLRPPDDPWLARSQALVLYLAGKAGRPP